DADREPERECGPAPLLQESRDKEGHGIAGEHEKAVPGPVDLARVRVSRLEGVLDPRALRRRWRAAERVTGGPGRRVAPRGVPPQAMSGDGFAISLRARWTSTVVAVLGIAGTVAVFVAMLSLARGFEATLVASGSPLNAIVRRAGATSEMDSSVVLDQVRVIEDAPGIERGDGGALVSPEVVVVAAFPLKGRGTEGNAQVRGVSPKALALRPTVKIVAGRFFQPGLTELVVGRNVAGA